MLLIKNAEVYSPAYLGKNDVLISNDKIEYIAENIEGLPGMVHELDGQGLVLTPGIIDQHVHVTGGGGEGGFHTRTPELKFSELIEGGITTVVGLLGTDGMTRSVENLYAKISALNEEGVTAYMVTGAYGYPGPTITGAPDRDIVFIREVLGMKLALSDHRAPNITSEEFIQVASKVRVAGMMSGKAGILLLHMGDAPQGFKLINHALEQSALPIRMFRPTHVNRDVELLKAGYEHLKRGGYVDYTCGMKGPSPAECIVRAAEQGISTDYITISSDGYGSWSEYNDDGTLSKIGVSRVNSLYRELQHMVNDQGIELEQALIYVSTNVAKGLDLYPRKGCIRTGSDADLLLFSKDLNLYTVIAKGKVLMENGNVIRKGTYE